MMRRVFKFFLGGSILMSLFVFASVYYLPYLVGEVKNPVAGLFNPLLSDIQKPDFGKYGLNGQTFKIRVNDSIALAGYYIPATNGPIKGTVVALHGYRSNKNKYLPVIRYFIENGYDFIAVDLRGHNESDGTRSGFSFYEKEDIDHLIDSLKNKGVIRSDLILYGHSVGAATAVEVVARRTDVKALVLESFFPVFSGILPNYIEFYLGFQVNIPDEMRKSAFDYTGIDPDSINPGKTLSKLKIPVLLIHGGQDKKVPVEQTHDFFRQLKMPKKWIVVDSATHNTLWEKGGANYFKEIISFLDSIAGGQSNFSNGL